MFNPSRDQVRQFFFDTWAKYRSGQPLAGAEVPALQAILAHPEYHRMLDEPERYRERDYPPELGETNPFMHLSMHLAIAEQVSIDQPPGIRARYQRLLQQQGDAMQAQHAVMECLAEMIWQVQRHQTAFDSAAYLRCLDGKLGDPAIDQRVAHLLAVARGNHHGSPGAELGQDVAGEVPCAGRPRGVLLVEGRPAEEGAKEKEDCDTSPRSMLLARSRAYRTCSSRRVIGSRCGTRSCACDVAPGGPSE